MKHSIEYYKNMYARIVIRKGVNLRPGQKLLVRTSYETYEFARLLAKEAYEAGSDYVYIETIDYSLYRSRMEHQDKERLQYNPNFTQSMYHQFLAEDWAYIRLDNTEDRSQFDEVDADKLAILQGALREDSSLFRASMMRHEHPWCVICAPGINWARTILGEDATIEELYELLIPILRLDEKDPLAAWDDHAKNLLELSGKMTEISIRELHLTDESTGTDLYISLREQAIWIGGPKRLPSGRLYFPNIPTEEVFSVPDRLLTRGKAVTTKPVTIYGSQVTGCEFTFEEGRLVSYKAQKGQRMLEKFVSSDAGAAYLGEIALVDVRTPISMSGKVFSSILYDENAACHIALGAGYPSCLRDGKSLDSDEKLLEAGCNRSVMHTDFMIGSPSMSIVAHCYDGSSLTIMKEGKILI